MHQRELSILEVISKELRSLQSRELVIVRACECDKYITKNCRRYVES